MVVISVESEFQGMIAAEGDVILMVDADGASDINDFEKCVVAVIHSLSHNSPVEKYL